MRIFGHLGLALCLTMVGCVGDLTAPTPEPPAVDAGATPDAHTTATPDAGATSHDAGATSHDAGATSHDAGATSHDAGATPDAGATSPDSGAVGPGPGDAVQFLPYPAQNTRSNAAWGSALTDIAQHLPASYGTQYDDADLITFGHETTHGINSELRNNHNATGQRANGFYVMGDKGVILVEPNILKSAVAPLVPASLRGSRYDLYLVGQTAWDDTPTYLFDEWVAYTNGAAVGVDLEQHGLWTAGWRDAVAGPLEFSAYAIALGMAVEQGDPTYFRSNTQFRELLAWNLRRAMTLYRQGAVMPDFRYDVQDAYYQSLRTGSDAEPLRQFLRRSYGDSFTNQVLGL